MEQKRFVVGLGEALWDVLPEGKKLGGAPANFAYHAGQFGLQTLAISALGEDALAEETIEALKEHGLNYLMPRVPYPTGTVQVTLSGDGIPAYEIKENVHGTTFPTHQRLQRLPVSAVPFVSVRWLSAMSLHGLPSASSLTTRQRTA